MVLQLWIWIGLFRFEKKGGWKESAEKNVLTRDRNNRTLKITLYGAL
jgi:hypothetical protein